MRGPWILVLFPLLAFGQISAVRIAGTTATQVIASYTAPDERACALAVSTSSKYSPLAHDVDESLFPGSSSDFRPGSIHNGRSRLVVIGRHGMTANESPNPFLASDGKRYSRALEADTLYYYRVTCGRDTASGTFTTANILPGNTAAEPLAADAARPGEYNWPSVVHPSSRAESIVDPNTGALIRKVTLSSESDSPGNANGWPDGGMFQVCSHLTRELRGHTYTLCYVPGAAFSTLYSIETDTGNAYSLTRLSIPYGRFGCSSTGTVGVNKIAFHPDDPLKFYLVGFCAPDFLLKVYAAKWTGPLNVSRPVPATDLAPQSALSLTLLTPRGLAPMLAAYDPAYDSAQQAKLQAIEMGGTQMGKLVFRAIAAQDGMGWIFVFDPGNDQEIGRGGTGAIVAAIPEWKAPVSRWCTIHTLVPNGDRNPWIGVSSNSPAFHGYMMGAYTVTVANNAGAGNALQIAPQNGSYEPLSADQPHYLQDAQPGDLFYVGGPGRDREIVELVSKDEAAHTWTVLRGNQYGSSLLLKGSDVPPGAWKVSPIAAGTRLYEACRAVGLSSHTLGYAPWWWWNFVDDPHGTKFRPPPVNGTASDQVVEEFATGGHQVTRNSINVMAGASAPGIGLGWIWWEYPNSIPGYDLVKFSKVVNANPGFAGIEPAGGGNTYQQHPNYDLASAGGAAPRWFVDALPFTNESGAYRDTAALVPGQSATYKITGAEVHRKQLTTLASCGAHPLVDISSAATGDRISDATPYTYCVAGRSGECRRQASAGDIYVSCPKVTRLACDTQPRSGATDLCLGDAWAYGNAAVQISPDTSDRNGASGRVISQLFSTHHEEWIYNNVRPTSDGRWLLFATPNLTGTNEIYMAKLPPFPAPASPRHDTFVPVNVSIEPRPGASNAVVEFGYLENGGAGDFYCTTRREACIAQTAAVAPADPFLFAESESRAIRGMPCRSGCAIAVPALPGRVVYYRVDWRDDSGRVIGRQEIRVQTVP